MGIITEPGRPLQAASLDSDAMHSMKYPMNIVLIGYRGSGKSTVGRRLAARLAREFVDTDDLVAAEAAMTIREVFQREGEAGFRIRERAAVQAAAAKMRVVIAAGGGAILDDANRRVLSETGAIVWLRAPADVLWQRTLHDSRTPDNRPILTARGGREEVEALLAQREPIYQSNSQLVIDTQAIDVQTVCLRIEEGLAAADLL